MIEEEKINSWFGAITKQAGVQPSRMLISSVLSIWKGQMRTAAASSNPG